MEITGLKERTLAAVAAEPAPTRGELRRRTVLVMALALIASLLVFLFAGGVRPTGRPPVLIAGTVAGALMLAGLAAWGALGRGGSMLGRPRSLLLAMVIAVPLSLVLWKLALSYSVPGMTRVWVERPGWRCFRWSLLMGIGPLVALAILRRGSEPLHPVATGAAIGVAAGAGAWVMIDLWCPVAFPLHLLIGHILPLSILALVGAVLGRKLLSVRG